MKLCSNNPYFCETESKVKQLKDYQYFLNLVLGRGSLSIVYEGKKIANGMPVAIKVTTNQYKIYEIQKNILQEFEILAHLNSPYILKCTKIMKSQTNLYSIMELCERKNLAIIIKQFHSNQQYNHSTHQNYLNEKILRFQTIIFDIFLGLKYLQEKSIIHRDLKPSNILFDRKRGTAKIADFGFATKSFSDFISTNFAGTPEYLPPEAFFSQQYGSKTDIWSFGIILYEIIFGNTPVSHCKTKNQLIQKISQQINLCFSEQDTPIAQLIQGCLDPNVLTRWNIHKIQSCQFIQKIKNKNYQNNKNSQLIILNENGQSSVTQKNIQIASQKKLSLNKTLSALKRVNTLSNWNETNQYLNSLSDFKQTTTRRRQTYKSSVTWNYDRTKIFGSQINMDKQSDSNLIKKINQFNTNSNSNIFKGGNKKVQHVKKQKKFAFKKQSISLSLKKNRRKKSPSSQISIFQSNIIHSHKIQKNNKQFKYFQKILKPEPTQLRNQMSISHKLRNFEANNFLSQKIQNIVTKGGKNYCSPNNYN